uniref:glycoside hydrolase family 2 TIM barrel-domain containing protein n=1 Tax=Niallia taxi TaxID=2499688 RepID=UPI0015F7276A
YISCEYMHAMGNSLGGMYKYTELEQKYPMYQGGFIWDYIDQSLYKKDRFGKEYLAYGGDFDDRPTDYGFCTNGIVYATRKLSPKMQEVKFLYQDFKLVPDQNGVLIKNESLFTNTENYHLLYKLFLNGNKISTKKLSASVQPQSASYVAVSFPANLTEAPGEYCIQASFVLQEKTLWADAGYEIAFGQYIFEIGEKQLPQPIGEIKTVHGDVNIGVHGKDFTVMFSKQSGSLVSLSYAGKEMISMPPAPLFWRATTDNDRGYSQSYHSGLWYAASLARQCTDIQVEESSSQTSVAFTYAFSVHEDIEVKVVYTVLANGSIHVKSVYKGAAKLPQLPIFALSFKLPAEYSQTHWYAFGPEENYSDRAMGAKLSRFDQKVSDNLAGYVMPQESGNRTGVRYVSVTNEQGHGINISYVNKPLECNFSPYTAFELENAQHVYELPNIHYTVATIAGRQMGVGGDDSWGAPVHKEHLLNASEDIEFEFVIERR